MNMQELPKIAMGIPQARPDAEEIVGVVKENSRIVGYKLYGGKTVYKEEAVDMARSGGIKGVGISSRNGSEYLKSIPDGTENNNLDSLPIVES